MAPGRVLPPPPKEKGEKRALSPTVEDNNNKTMRTEEDSSEEEELGMSISEAKEMLKKLQKYVESIFNCLEASFTSFPCFFSVFVIWIMYK